MLTDSRWLTYQVWFWLLVQWSDAFHLGEDVNKRRCRFERAGLVRLRLVGTDWERFCICCVWEQEISVGSGSVASAACRDYPNPRQAFWQRALHVSGATAGWWRGDEEGRVRRSSQCSTGQFRSKRGGGRTENSCLDVFLCECSVPPSRLCGKLTKLLLSWWEIFVSQNMNESLQCCFINISIFSY